MRLLDSNADSSSTALWGLAALTAAERKLPQPSSGEVSWQNIAVKVFNAIAARWDRSTCGGGLQWQIFTFNAGNDYKNAQASGFFYLLAARLAQYTGNQTYADWATQTYDWSERTGLVTKDGKVYDGFSTKFNCSIPPNNFQWSYNAAAYTYGSIIMANIVSRRLPLLIPIRTFYESFRYHSWTVDSLNLLDQQRSEVPVEQTI